MMTNSFFPFHWQRHRTREWWVSFGTRCLEQGTSKTRVILALIDAWISGKVAVDL